MPILHNSNLDDPLALDVQRDFSKGQVSNARANLLDIQQGARLRNVVLDYAGVLESRRGFRNFGTISLDTASTSASGSALQGLYYYDTLGSEKLIAAASGNLYYYDATSATWASLSAATAHIPTTGDVWFTQVADKLYFTGGSGNIAEYDGTEVEPDTSTAATGLRYLVSHGFRVFGAANVDEVWCSLILPDAGSNWLEDDDGNIIKDDLGNRITAGYKAAFGTNATFRVGQGDGDKITSLVPWSDFNLLVFKEGSTYAVNTNPAVVSTAEATGTEVAQFIVRTVSNRIGCASHRSAVQVDNDCFFLARDGVRSVARTIQDGTQGVSPALSYPIDDIIRRINWDVADVACAAFWRGKYILAIPVDGSTVNSMIIVYDKNLNAWTYWDGISPREFMVTRFGGSPQKLVCLENNGNVLELRDWFGFEQSGASDYSDLLVIGADIEAPAGVSLAEDTPVIPREGYYFHYGVSFKTAAGETAMSNVVSSTDQQAIDGYPFEIGWDAPAVTGLTARIWGSVDLVGTVPSYSDFILLKEKSADLNLTADGESGVNRLSDMASYVGDRPLEADNFSATVETRPAWQIRSRAFTFQDPIAPKKPNHLELEFDRSNARIDVDFIVDGDVQDAAVAESVSTGAGFLHLPFTLPATLGDGKVIRKRYNVDNFNPGREIQVEMTEAKGMTTVEAQQSEYLRLREINVSAFLETMEDQE